MTTEKQRVRFRQVARRQHGVISLDQALEAGYTRQGVARKVAAKAWFRLGPRVYLLGEHDETPRARTVAAMLSLGDDATLVARSAIWWWQMHDTAPAQVDVAVSPTRRPRDRPGVHLRRRPIAPADRTRVDGLAVTGRALSVLDGAAPLGLDDAARVADRALLTEKITVEALRDAHIRNTGRAGAAAGAELIALAAGGARSEAERRTHRVLRGAGLREWAPNVEIELPGYGRAVADLLVTRERVIVEIDGWAYHRDLRAFLRDGPRQSALHAAGYLVLRTHWYELRDDPGAFLARLRAVLAARS